MAKEDDVIIGARKEYALYDFDERRILQRKFFSDLNLPPNMTDAEILRSFDVSTIDAVENTRARLSTILQRLRDYLGRMKEHSAKLEDLSKKFAVKFAESGDEKLKKRFERAKILSSSVGYGIPIQGIIRLGGTIADMILGLQNTIDSLYRKRFSERLKQARNEKGYTQKQLAAELEMAAMTLSQYETRKREPSISILAKIAKKLNVSTDWLLGLA